MTKLKPLVRCVALAFGGSLMLAGGVALAQQRQETIEVTGSNIKRVDAETVAPVEIITREQIQRTGQPTVAEVLRNIPANTAGSLSEQYGNNFAPGSAGISLRGLGQKTTLVLINGRRTAGYGFAQNIQETFVDLNSIPSSAVERIEVLRDGASAIYGSDAIAGVVNVILRKDYKGIEFGGGAGSFEGKSDYRFNIVGGMGDLAKDKYSLMGVFDFYKRDLVMLSDTEFGASRDMRKYQGGRNFTSLTGGGTWRQLTAANALTANHQAIAGCRGRIITGAEAVELGLIAAPLGNTAFNIAGNTFCSQDFNNEFTALPRTQRMGFLGRGNFEFSPTLFGYAELAYSRVETYQKFQDPFFAGTTALTQTAAGLRPFTYNINFAPGVAGNPFPTNARYVGVLADMGTRDNDITSDTYRVLGGLKYTFGSWDFDSGLTFAKNKVENMNITRLSRDGVSAVFGVTSAPQPPIPTSTSSTYNLNNPASNSQAVRDQMRITFPRRSTSELSSIDTKATTEFGNLPGGPVGVAVGVDYRTEKMRDVPDPRAQRGDILGQGITQTTGSRNIFAAYAEFALPITKSIEGQLAARYDHYSDYGTSTTPKVGIKWKAADNILLRANWGKGFRAPTLPEISPSVATFFTTVTDPLNNQLTQVSGVYAGNPNLKPERSTSGTIGLVFEPVKNFSVSLDAYDLKWKDIVRSPSIQSIVNGGGPGVIRDPSTNAIVTVLGGYINQAETRTKGVDVDLRYAFTTGWGRFTPRVIASYIHSFKENGTEVVGTNGGSNTIPRIKATVSLDWDQGPWAATARANYVHSYYQVFLPASYFTNQDPRFQTGTYPNRVGQNMKIDLFLRYQVNKNLQVSGAVLNVANKLPPFDPAWGTTLFDYTLYDVRGRQYRLGFTYKM
jgi:iron complex outermembrane receptor protein